ncbi:hypothetical protein K431DRAFT_280179 [Polychaeton citri CBS 116435]|uniref:Zn(2)-C6 fungal-type domain-containing protein n=1 Tax=Polychaeton citri CBS 116435 TaxID=1314669 RepID=A0A9P4QJZ8_9PEZI|nr:hypothetical protein K431DRAFT_280179 [Polychaeton citri CBS 116435]
MSDTDTAPARSSYPPPSNAMQSNLSHPFYHQLHESSRHVTPHSQHAAGSPTTGSRSPDSNLLPQRPPDIPDDPQLRASLTNMMEGGNHNISSMGNIAQLLQQSNSSIEVVGTQQPVRATHDAVSSLANNGRLPEQEKRTKVSRACDECRRKKIRCDAADETGNPPCSSCARTGIRCAFSRQPQKRGPSKGYIKELAERLNSLESQMHIPPQLQGQQQEEIRQVQRALAEEGHIPTARGYPGSRVEARAGEKRTYDEFRSQQHQHHQQQQSEIPWSSQSFASRQIQSTPQYSSPSNMILESSNSYNRDDRAGRSSTQPFWRAAGTENILNTHQPNEVENAPATIITNFDWDEEVINEYYRIIHQTFPILPSNKNRLRQRISDCPASLREAFITALDCLMRTFPTTVLPPNAGYSQALRRAAELLAGYPFDDPSTHTNGTNLIYLQTLIIMALECDNHGPATIRGQAGPSRAEWLGRAAGVAGTLGINLIRSPSISVMGDDRDSEEHLARRVWWVLFILDRWHASSTADLLKLPENSVVLLPEDQILLGESTYHLARLSFIIGHLAAILTTTKTPSTNVMAPSNPASSLLGLTLAGEIDRFRESVESVWGSLNLVHLSYHHCHLLIKRLNPTTEPTELVGHAVKVATVLNSRLTPLTPLNHHFAALSAMTLCELCDVPKTRAEATKGIDHLFQCLGEGKGLAGKQESEGWDGAVRELVVGKRQSMLRVMEGNEGVNSLHGLANAAAGSGEGSASVGATDGDRFDPTMLTRYGYLTALGQGMFKTKLTA